MRIEKEHMDLENIDEIRIYNAPKKDFYIPTPQEFDIDEILMSNLIDNIPVDIHTFIPYENGKDFIIESLGSFTLKKYNCTQEDAKGRLLSKLSPLFFDILHDYLLDVYENHTVKMIRFVYYKKNKLTKLSNAKILFDMDRIFIITNNVDTGVSKWEYIDDDTFDEDKSSMMENFSQTGSYYNINGKYTWSQGIYNIINRPKEESDDFYNIVFDLVIPDDQHIVDKIFDTTNKETAQCNEIIRIMTRDEVMKIIEVKPVDFLLDGFKNSKKLALLIEPLNKKQYKFSKGFYYLIEKDYEEYDHSRKILDNVVEKDAIERLNKLCDGEISKIDETITLNVDGNPYNQKVVDLYIESFRYKNDIHSLGFLTDITEEMEKQHQLIESNEQRLILIKEIHHRVKNNLQILNSFLNLEKRTYKNDPKLIIEHMQTRLTSLALLHEKTYKSQDFKNINLNEYLLDQDSQTKDLMDLPVEVEFETYVDEDLNLTIEVITPLLLIIDELTMNAIKHAFPDKSAPNKKIIKNITKLDDNTAMLIIKDNGVGIKNPKKISKNLGCEIVKSLTKQLGGNISLIETENGTAYRLIFPTKMEHTIN